MVCVQTAPRVEPQRLQRFQKVEMRVGRFHFHAMMTGARGNKQIVRRHPFARFAAAVCQLARRLPHFIN
jgi:hypothetical protein